MERAAQTLTPVSLELGGKDPMIVLADANLERAANAAVYYSMQNGGQTCVSIERRRPRRCARARPTGRARSTWGR
jgi:acyl-CoA reductase-like NAD-dependent aldehyde dehydrogenase